MTRLSFYAALVGSIGVSVMFAAEPANDAKAPAASAPAPAARSPYTGGNRLAYLDEINPYYPHKDFAKLITPQWVGEEGVEAVVILAIDDMRDPARYEQYLRPILDRLKTVGNSDGLSRMSIFTNSVDPKHAQLQAWLKEGVTFEVHTITHPCPCLGAGPGLHNSTSGDIKKAKATYDGCVDLLHQIPNYKGPVAFRMPCCDSMNSVSPRFFAEVMNKTTEKGHFLSIDSSVFNVFTSDDPALPRELVLEKDEREGAAPDAKRGRFAKYAQFPGFVNTIENYPYPYVVGNMIWQFPCVVPSDWEAQHLHKPNNPKTVEDLKANLDCTVIKQGVFTLVFHPHGWIKAEQIVELIDHAEKKHGKKVKFMTFRDALERINKSLFRDAALRNAKGDWEGFQLFDVEQKRKDDQSKIETDGYLDILHFAPLRERTRGDRHWEASLRRWIDKPSQIHGWQRPIMVQSPVEDSVAFAERPPVPIVFFDDPAMRRIDFNGDGRDDLVFSNGTGFAVYLSVEKGKEPWKKIVSSRRAAEAKPGDIPPIIRADGTNNGFFVKGDALYWQNEDTGGKEPHHVKKITFKEVLALGEPGPVAPKDAPKSGAQGAPARGLQAPVPAAPGAPSTGGTYEGKNFTTAHPAPPPARSIEDSLKSIQVREGFRVELVASEPLTMDPIAFDWGPDGKLWIVEMADYPSGIDAPGGKGKPGGRIVYLEDIDNDGKYDKRTVFLDGISFPTGVMVWKKGVLVTGAPDIFYAEDTDNDGKADKREVLFTGFGEGNQQHRVNGLRWGLDGWIYLGNGDSGGNIKNVATGEVTNINGRDLRIRQNADGKWQLDPQSGQTQFGRERDDFGNWFGNNNPNPGWHYALEDHYLRRNPHVAAPNPRVDLTGDRTIYPISIVHSPSIENHRITPGQPAQHSSANSLCPYRDDLYGPDFASSIFISEPVHNLVRRLVLKPQGVTFRAERPPGEEKRDFLASSDPWFRPTMLRTGPDGCLWIADMHRQTIEHPQWIPPAWQKLVNLREGEDKGRIYRVVPVEKKPRVMVKLDKLDAKGLVAALDSPNGWQRDMVQMMLTWKPPLSKSQRKKLVELEDAIFSEADISSQRAAERKRDELLATSPVPGALLELATKSPRAATRAQAFGTLASLHLVAESVKDLPIPFSRTRSALMQGIKDSDANVRRIALQVSEPMFEFLESDGYNSLEHAVKSLIQIVNDEYYEAVVALTADDSRQVRQQLASLLGRWPDARAGRPLATLLIENASDPYITAAAMSSVLPHLDTVMKELIGPPGAGGAIPADQLAARAPIIEKLIGVAVAADKLETLASMLEVVTIPRENRYAAWQFTALSRLLDAMGRRNLTLVTMRASATRQVVNNWADAAAGKKLLMTLDRIEPLLTGAKSVVIDPREKEDLRIAAIELFARLGGEQRLSTLTQAMTNVQSPPQVQQAAAAAIGRLGGVPAHKALLAGWGGHSPALRSAIIDSLVKQDDAMMALLNAIEKRFVSPHDVDIPRRQPFINHKDEAIRAKAGRVFGGLPDADRQKVIDAYTAELAKIGGGGGGASVSADAARGKALFEKNCAACHRLGDVGKTGIAPDLSKVADASQQGMLISILDPNRAVEAKYVSYLAETKGGDIFTGIVTSETGGSITIVGVDGIPRTIPRSELESLRSTGLSLMPNGLEQAMKPADVADLFAFIASHGPSPKSFPGNEPRKITADDNGVLTLPASAAEIRGPTLIFEQQYKNLGYWSSEQDSATWVIEIRPPEKLRPRPQAGGVEGPVPERPAGAGAVKYDVTLDWALANASKAHAFQLLVAGQRVTGPVDSTGSWDVYRQAKVGTLELAPGTHRVVFRSLGAVNGALIDLRGIALRPSK